MKNPMQLVEDADDCPRQFQEAGAARYPDIDPQEYARAERSAEIYGSGYLVLVEGVWRSFCGEEVRIIKKQKEPE